MTTYGDAFWQAFNNPMVGAGKNFDSFHKALTGLGGTDEGALTGGSALRIQSLDAALKDVIETEEDFKFWRMLRHRPVWSMVDYYNQRTDIGGYPRSGFTGETGPAKDYNQSIARQYISTAFIMHRGQVSWAAQNQKSTQDVLASEQQAVMLRCVRDAETGILDGQANCSVNEFNGLRYNIENRATADHIADLRAEPIQWTDVTQLQGFIRAYKNFGQITDVLMSVDTLIDFQNVTQDLLRAPIQTVSGVAQPQMINLSIGALNTSFGTITPHSDIFIREDKLPPTIDYSDLAGTETYSPDPPVAVTPAVAALASSLFNQVAYEGSYYYLVIGRAADNSFSTHVVTAVEAAVSSGEAVTLTIQPSAAGTEGYYEIYRSKKLAGGAAAPSAAAGTDNYRYIGKVAKAALGNTTYVDDNGNIPGTSEMYLITNKPEKDAIDIAVFAEPFQFPLAATVSPVYPFLGVLMCALRVTKPRQHALIKNILPSRATWLPFG